MSMRITMLQTRQGEEGEQLLEGEIYTVSDAFGAYLVGLHYALDTDDTLNGDRYAHAGSAEQAAAAGTVNTAYTRLELDQMEASGLLVAGTWYSPSDQTNPRHLAWAETTASLVWWLSGEPTFWGDGTWDERPNTTTHPTLGTNDTYFVSDVGNNGALCRWNGTYWYLMQEVFQDGPWRIAGTSGGASGGVEQILAGLKTTLAAGFARAFKWFEVQVYPLNDAGGGAGTATGTLAGTIRFGSAGDATDATLVSVTWVTAANNQRPGPIYQFRLSDDDKIDLPALAMNVGMSGSAVSGSTDAFPSQITLANDADFDDALILSVGLTPSANNETPACSYRLRFTP